jgi:ribosomal protein L7Ae-like RNA K-turn-binding protein
VKSYKDIRLRSQFSGTIKGHATAHYLNHDPEYDHIYIKKTGESIPVITIKARLEDFDYAQSVFRGTMRNRKYDTNNEIDQIYRIMAKDVKENNLPRDASFIRSLCNENGVSIAHNTLVKRLGEIMEKYKDGESYSISEGTSEYRKNTTVYKVSTK